MEILEAIRSRRSTRGYKPDPVPRKVLEELLDTCRWAPSSTNTQPWEFAILGGKVMEEIKVRLDEETKEQWTSNILGAGSRFKDVHPDIPIPAELPEPYLKRQLDLRDARDSHQFPPGTDRLDEKRAEYLFKGSRFHDAPNGIIIYAERALGPHVAFDLGLMAQTIALAAPAYGLGTCIMGRVVNWPEILREILGIPESKLIVVGMAIGYPDPEAVEDTYPRHREPLETFANWHGV